MTRYEQGFINKCAEYGVDGSALLKRAQFAQGLGNVVKGGAKAVYGALTAPSAHDDMSVQNVTNGQANSLNMARAGIDQMRTGGRQMASSAKKNLSAAKQYIVNALSRNKGSLVAKQ